MYVACNVYNIFSIEIISYQQHENNHHKLRQKANLQRDEITMIKCLKKQHQEEKSVLKAHIKDEFKS